MRSTTALVVVLAALTVFAACSSEPSRPAPVANYGPEAPEPNTPFSSGSPDGRAAAPRGPVRSGSVRWHTRLADAQADARATGRLILALSTKPRCGLCEKFKNRIAPGAAGELNQVAVGYIYDITRPEVRRVDQTLRANLRGADLMPLVGFLTPDLGYIHGFWGPRSVTEFRGDIARADRSNPMRGARVRTPGAAAAPRIGVVNEFGETEWSPAIDVWAPLEAPPLPREVRVADAPVVAAASPDSSTRNGPAIVDLPALEPVVTSSPKIDAPVVAELPALEPAVEIAPAPVRTAPAPAAPVAEVNTILNPSTGDDLTAWGRTKLERARDLIRAGEYTDASQTLSQVRSRMAGTTLAREASKGGVALYNAKRIRLASNGAERNRYLMRARRDLGSSMWGELFGS